MALRTVCQINSIPSKFTVFMYDPMYLHKNRKYVIDNKRNFTRSGREFQKTCGDQRPDNCPSRTCNKKKKSSFWGGLFGKNKAKELPSMDICRIKQECKPDPDLSTFGGQPYKTCGSAYIIQKDMLPVVEVQKPTKEQEMIKKIETTPELKHLTGDPMPQFTSCEQRMLELQARRLHPFYRRYQTIPKKTRTLECFKAPMYKTSSCPISPDEYPVHLKYNKELLEKKNLYAEYKRVQPPRQLLAKMVELRYNERKTLERKKHLPPTASDCQKYVKRQNVYDTLYQDDIKF